MSRRKNGSARGGRGPASTAAELRARELFAPWPGAAAAFGVFANVLFSHNTLVGLMCFGLGLAAGVPTLLLTLYQGLALGAFIALHFDRGLTIESLGWLSIHGTTELGAIILLAAETEIAIWNLTGEHLVPVDALDEIASLGRVVADSVHSADQPSHAGA